MRCEAGFLWNSLSQGGVGSPNGTLPPDSSPLYALEALLIPTYEAQGLIISQYFRSYQRNLGAISTYC